MKQKEKIKEEGLKTCEECGVPYGKDRRLFYGCKHHPINTEYFKLPEDYKRVESIVISEGTS